MFCEKCGNQLSEDAKFCSSCGAPVGEPIPTVQIQEVAIQPKMDEVIHTVNGVQFNALEVAIQFDLLGKNPQKSEATTHIMNLTGAGMWKGSAALTNILNDKVIKEKFNSIKAQHADFMDQQGVRCPKCFSTKIEIDKQGFSGGKALVGGLLTGGIGLVAGFHGRNKRKGKCLVCGHSWKI